MADSPERPTKSEQGESFPIPALSDFARFDKLFPPQQKTEPGDRNAPVAPIAPIAPVPPLRPVAPIATPAPQPPKFDVTKPGDRPPAVVPPVIFPPINELQKPQDKNEKLKAGPDGKYVIGEKDFDKIGPKAAQVLKDAGVTKITITPGNGFDTYEAELKKPLDVAQDPAVDGCRKLKIAQNFKADVVKNPDGSYTLDNIQGLTAETKVLFKWQDASVDKIKLRSTPDGKSEITSTGSWNGFSRDNTRVKPGEIFDKAKILFDRMSDLKQAAPASNAKPSFLEIPAIPRR